MKKQMYLISVAAALLVLAGCTCQGNRSGQAQADEPQAEEPQAEEEAVPEDEFVNLEIGGGLDYTFSTACFTLLSAPEINEVETNFALQMNDGDADSSVSFRVLHHGKGVFDRWSRKDLDEVLEMDISDPFDAPLYQGNDVTLKGETFERLDPTGKMPGCKMAGTFVYNAGTESEYAEETVMMATVLHYNIILMRATTVGGNMERLLGALEGFSVTEE